MIQFKDKVDQLSDTSYLKLDNVPDFLSDGLTEELLSRLIKTRKHLEVGHVSLEYYTTDTHEMILLPAYWDGEVLMLNSCRYEPSSAYSAHEHRMENALEKEIGFVIGRHRTDYPRSRPQVTVPGQNTHHDRDNSLTPLESFWGRVTTYDNNNVLEASDGATSDSTSTNSPSSSD